jgi:RHS repeat-associated protein
MQSTNSSDGSCNGVFREYEIYVTSDASSDPANWGTPVATGEWLWPNLQERRDLYFPPAVGRYVYFRRVSAYGWYSDTSPGYASANEVWVYAGGWSPAVETRYVYDGMRVVQERDGNNRPLAQYTRGWDLSGSLEGAGGIGGLLALSRLDGLEPQAAFHHSDGGGNVTALINAHQAVVARYLYEPLGNLLAQSGPWAEANRHRFSGKEHHPASGLYHYGYRFYDPMLQRWINRDPLGEAGGLNHYGFAANNPLRWVDPWGLEFVLTGNEVIDAGLEGFSRAGEGVVNAFTGGLFDPTAGLFYDYFNRRWEDLDSESNEGDSAFQSGLNGGRTAVGCLAAAGGVRASGIGTRIGLHGPHHSFGRLGRLPHLQLNWWRPGIKGSGGVVRLPLPPLP